MKRTDTSDGLLASLRTIRRGEPGILVRVFVSVAVTCMMIGVGLIGAVAIDSLIQHYDMVRSRHAGDLYLALSFVVAAISWAALLLLIWRGQSGRLRFIGPLIRTIVFGGATTLACILIDEFRVPARDWLNGAIILFAAGITILIWMNFVLAAIRGNPVLTADRIVNVRCPQCDYSLVGLRELRCPECGTTFAIDELIREQGYGREPVRDAATS